MKSFKLFLKEGGNSVKNVTRINQENVAATLKDIDKKLAKALKLDKKSMMPIGSTGKKAPGESSGDIDIALDLHLLVKNHKLKSVDDIYDTMKKILSPMFSEVHINKGLAVMAVAFPIANIDGLQKGENVQLDLMFVEDMDFAKFAYWSPLHYESKYKSAYRNILMNAIAAFVDEKVLERGEFEGEDVPVKWSKYVFDIRTGFKKIIKSRLGKKGVLKNSKTIDVTLMAKGKDPDFIAQTLLGKEFDKNDATSFETVYGAVMSNKFLHKKFRKKILTKAAKDLVNVGFIPPKDIQKYA